MPSVTDWISSIASLVGGLAGIGALIVAILSYLRSNRALAADRQTRGAVRSAVDAVDALGDPGHFDATLDAALRRRAAETHESVIGGGSTVSRGREAAREKREAYENALADARRKLGASPEATATD